LGRAIQYKFFFFSSSCFFLFIIYIYIYIFSKQTTALFHFLLPSSNKPLTPSFLLPPLSHLPFSRSLLNRFRFHHRFVSHVSLLIPYSILSILYDYRFQFCLLFFRSSSSSSYGLCFVVLFFCMYNSNRLLDQFPILNYFASDSSSASLIIVFA
jgi:hypothetical protein